MVHMGTNEIVEKIRSEAQAEYERIINEANENAKKKLEEVRKELELQKKRFIEADERKGVEEKERMIRAARQHARKLKWMVEEEMSEKAFEAAMKRIKEVKRAGFKGKSYQNILAGLIMDGTRSIAAEGSEAAELEVLLSEEDVAYLNHSLLKEIANKISQDNGVKLQLSLSDERVKSAGGVIVRRKDGKIEVNHTFEQRMARFSTGLRENIVKTLFSRR